MLRFLADGRLDPAFGRRGATWFSLRRPPGDVEDMRNTAASIAVLRDGRIAFAGGIRETRSSVWMLRPDGTLDRSFGRDGRVVLSP